VLRCSILFNRSGKRARRNWRSCQFKASILAERNKLTSFVWACIIGYDVEILPVGIGMRPYDHEKLFKPWIVNLWTYKGVNWLLPYILVTWKKFNKVIHDGMHITFEVYKHIDEVTIPLQVRAQVPPNSMRRGPDQVQVRQTKKNNEDQCCIHSKHTIPSMTPRDQHMRLW
jgi:hypothetical protein